MEWKKNLTSIERRTRSRTYDQVNVYSSGYVLIENAKTRKLFGGCCVHLIVPLSDLYAPKFPAPSAVLPFVTVSGNQSTSIHLLAIQLDPASRNHLFHSSLSFASLKLWLMVTARNTGLRLTYDWLLQMLLRKRIHAIGCLLFEILASICSVLHFFCIETTHYAISVIFTQSSATFKWDFAILWIRCLTSSWVFLWRQDRIAWTARLPFLRWVASLLISVLQRITNLLRQG